MLTFVSGPNRNADKGLRSTTHRTKVHALDPFMLDAFMERAVKETLRTGLDAMIKQGVQIAVLAKVSSGIYDIQPGVPGYVETNIQKWIEDVLVENNRYCRFRVIILPDIIPSADPQYKYRPKEVLMDRLENLYAEVLYPPPK